MCLEVPSCPGSPPPESRGEAVDDMGAVAVGRDPPAERGAGGAVLRRRDVADTGARRGAQDSGWSLVAVVALTGGHVGKQRLATGAGARPVDGQHAGIALAPRLLDVGDDAGELAAREDDDDRPVRPSAAGRLRPVPSVAAGRLADAPVTVAVGAVRASSA